jgi:hypothetical protein
MIKSATTNKMGLFFFDEEKNAKSEITPDPEPESTSMCLMARFKNERHIMFEFIHHYIAEGVDCFILIDDNSDDDYIEFNKDWMNELILSRKIIIKKATLKQSDEYNLHLNTVKKFKWVIMCDMDEFFFSVPEGSSLKSIVNDKLNIYGFIGIPWKIFKHDGYHHPKSVISDNVYTHGLRFDPTSISRGYKYIAKSECVVRLSIHDCKLAPNTKKKVFNHCHNNMIQNNHYRTQSEEYLRGVKEQRGGGVHVNKYKNFDSHKKPIYKKNCQLLAEKRKDLIDICMSREQVKPKIHPKSTFFRENIDNND